jgi:CspA family cold shock protein
MSAALAAGEDQGRDTASKIMEQTNVQGTVKFFKEDKGFGFIQRDEGGADLFVHISQCDESIDTLVRGQRVEFEEGTSSRSGKPEARRVIVLEASVERVRRYG